MDPDSIFCIPDGADIDFFVPRDPLEFRVRYGVPKDALVLGFSALDVTSDTDLVLQTVERVVSRRAEVMLLMTGNRPPAFDRMVSARRLDRHVRHLGLLPYEEVPMALSTVDVFLMPLRDTVSNRARWPHKICDYMSLGRPTVSQPVGEVANLFSEHPIGLLSTENPDDFAARVLELIADPARRARMGAEARKVAVERYAWPILARRLETCYEHAAHHRPGGRL